MKYTLDEQTEIVLLKTIILLCKSFGAKFKMVRHSYKNQHRLFIDLRETGLNIWMENENIIKAVENAIKEGKA